MNQTSMALCFATKFVETREDALETKGSQSSKKRSKVKDQQSENCTSDPKGGHKNKNESRRVAQDFRGMGQKTSENGENSTENGTDKIANLDDLCNQSISRTENISAGDSANDCSIMQQVILENSENVPVSNTNILLEEG